jgi:hypothetical protein
MSKTLRPLSEIGQTLSESGQLSLMLFKCATTLLE